MSVLVWKCELVKTLVSKPNEKFSYRKIAERNKENSKKRENAEHRKIERNLRKKKLKNLGGREIPDNLLLYDKWGLSEIVQTVL